MEYIQINSSQNVNIGFRAAGLFERIVAYIIDIVLISAYIFAIFQVIDTISTNFYQGRDSDFSFIMIVFILALPVFTFTLFFEVLLNGQTPGKIAMQIKVIKIDGYQASLIDYFIRWMFRLVEIYTFSGFIALFAILLSKNNQRLGEMASGTATISLKKAADLNNTILTNLEEDYKPTFTQVILLTDNDMRIIKENYDIAKLKKDVKTLQKLSDKIQKVLNITNPYQTNLQFISVIIKDYNYYTQYN